MPRQNPKVKGCDGLRIPHEVPGIFKWAVLVACTGVALTIAFGFVLKPLSVSCTPTTTHARSACAAALLTAAPRPQTLPVGTTAYLDLVRPNCSWLEEYRKLSPVGCFQWSAGTEARARDRRDGGQIERSKCSTARCSLLFHEHRGLDRFLTLEEAIRFDEAMARHVANSGGPCQWPDKMMRGDRCWQEATAYAQLAVLFTFSRIVTLTRSHHTRPGRCTPTRRPKRWPQMFVTAYIYRLSRVLRVVDKSP